jgi:hypothetical protein
MERIAAGTLVIIRTTNGGEICARLLQDFVPGYDADIGGPLGPILGWRIKSIEAQRGA